MYRQCPQRDHRHFCRPTLLGLKSAKFANPSPPPPLTDPEKGSELPKGSFGKADPKGSGLLGRDGLEAGDFLGGAGRGGGAFFCLGGKAGLGDSERSLLEGEGAKGSLPNKSPLDFCKTNSIQAQVIICFNQVTIGMSFMNDRLSSHHFPPIKSSKSILQLNFLRHLTLIFL